MDHICVIQEVVDAHKEDMPTGVTTRVMEECQKAYNEMPELYKLTWTAVDSHVYHEGGDACVKLSHKTQTLIVDAVDEVPDDPTDGLRYKMSSLDMPNYGMMLKSWLDFSTPRVLMNGADGMIIIHSIEPYHKRARKEA